MLAGEDEREPLLTPQSALSPARLRRADSQSPVRRSSRPGSPAPGLRRSFSGCRRQSSFSGSASRPPGPRPAWEVLPFDLWVHITTFVLPPAPRRDRPLGPEDRLAAVALAHTCTFFGQAVVTRWDPNWQDNTLRYGTDTVLCSSSAEVDVHAVLADTVLLHPIKHRAACELRDTAQHASHQAFQLLQSTAQWAYLLLFLPTTITLLGLARMTWKVWTVSVAAVLFCPLTYLGVRSSIATLKWWDDSHPRGWSIPPRPFHLCHPTPWLRVVAILSCTVVVGALLAWGSWVLGRWLDDQPFQATQWLLVALMICCYCP
eukprot:TRINITY_DN47648_c0_g1_i1.p1 TRINITY_DN47648_c0_g1~~TRINITY_DN47648_c0_g1_i1.p1  ORF type:complete len:351 (+),score=82.42 TRINITY_DN47648_c0_g1_i1:104-1054(+)